jgi:hypothetical protein
MKTIKLKICDPNLGQKFSYGTFFYNILKKYYNIELSENPDYVIYNESTYEYLKYGGVRILFVGENVTPNFNLCDYAVGFDYLTFQDRFYRMPLYLVAQFYSDQELELAGGMDFTKQRVFTREELSKKSGFCSFVYSNYLVGGQREEMFNKLSVYKKVDAGGGYLNNVGGRVKNKLAFERQYKFAIAFENSSRSGYTTEKLPNAISARTIPIYWGNPDVALEFNQKRFINCHAYKNFDEVIEKVKELDKNDELYLKTINEPVAAPGMDFNLVKSGFEKFLLNIFEQPLHSAKRRTINAARAANAEKGEVLAAKAMARELNFRKILTLLYRPFKRIIFLEKFKQKFLAKKLNIK